MQLLKKGIKSIFPSSSASVENRKIILTIFFYFNFINCFSLFLFYSFVFNDSTESELSNPSRDSLSLTHVVLRMRTDSPGPRAATVEPIKELINKKKMVNVGNK